MKRLPFAQRLRLRMDQLFVIAALALFVLFWIQSIVVQHRAETQKPVSDVRNAAGLSVFLALKNELQPGSAVAMRRAYFSPSAFAPYSTIYLLAPKRRLSDREHRHLTKWVQEGGKLVVSFHDEASFAIVKPYLVSAGITTIVGSVPGFHPGDAVNETARESKGFFIAGETYAFYGPLRFQDYECMKDSANCYLREGLSGKGGVVAIAGLAPFANGLIGRNDNAKLAARLAIASEKSAFDDYHQLVGEKTTSDLLRDPILLLPVIGLLLGVALYFFAGNEASDFTRARAANRGSPQSRRSAHAFNRQLIATVLASPGSLAEAGVKQVSFLHRLLGRQLPENSLPDPEHLAAELTRRGVSGAGLDREAALQIKRMIQFHQDWLKSRGRK